MKYNKKASILLWAIMLSLIISISFITISIQINKNIKLSGQISDFIYEQNKYNKLISQKQSDSLSDNKVLIFENNKSAIFGLKKGEEKKFIFSGSNDFSITIGKIEGADIFFSYYKNNNLTDSGIINVSETFTGKLDATNNTGTLNIKNLGGYSKIMLNSELEFKNNDLKYKIVTKIGNNFFNELKN